jgi:lambda family phage portal protein
MGRKREAKLKEALELVKRQAAISHLRAFEAAKQSRRTDNWYASGKGANADLRLSLQRIVNRHQDLVDSDPWAAKAISVVVSSWVGDGIIGKPLGASRRYGDTWREWSESTDCDWDGLGNLYAKQALIARTVAVRGSCLVRRRMNPELINKGLPPLQLQVLEPDYLDTSKDDGARIRFGKQYAENGKLEGYWLKRSHPGESDWTAARLTSDFVPASEICHVYDIRRPGQATGVPFGVAALLKLRDVSDRDAAQLLKDKLSACFMAFVEDVDPEAQAKPEQTLLDTLEPGTIEQLPPGKQVKFAMPPSSGDFVDVQKYHLLSIAQAYEITYESLTGDLSQVNFSSGRMGWMEMRRAVARWRWSIMIPQFLNPLTTWYRDAVAMANLGRGTARFEWTPPITWLTDPAREIPAYIEAVKAGIMSLSELHRMLGYVPEIVIQELGEDFKRARAEGLVLSVDVAAGGAVPPSLRPGGGVSGQANLKNVENESQNPIA